MITNNRKAHMPRSKIDSEILYKKIKEFFLTENRQQIIIEISDQPINQWKIIGISSIEEMISVRCDLVYEDQDFAGFIHSENKYVFYFSDQNIYKSEIIDSGQVEEFYDRTFSELDLNKVVKELRQLLQGS